MSNELQTKELTHGERFANKVLAEFKASAGTEIAINDYQKRLIQNYFVSIDAALKAAEGRRSPKRESLPVTWSNVNMESLAIDVVSVARVGLDPAQKNHVSFVPFKNNKTGKYEVVFIEGYVGLEYKAKKYALEPPLEVVCELVYSNDTFKPIKRSPQNAYESYDHEIVNPFDRGEVVGGFAYFIYPDPHKNRLMMMSKKDIMKRKPKHASAEFWGGEKDKWENGKKVGTEKCDGWLDEMCLKTIKRAAYNSIAIDPEKVDEAYQHMKRRERDFAELEVEQDINQNANQELIDVDCVVVDEEPGEIIDNTPEDAPQEPTQAPSEQTECGF